MSTSEKRPTSTSTLTGTGATTATATTAAKAESSAKQASTAPPSKTQTEGGSLDDLNMDEDEFAKQLASAMSEWMQEMENDTETKETFEKIWNKGGSQRSAGSAPAADPKSFQDGIHQALNKLKESNKTMESVGAMGADSDDLMMNEMMRQLESMAESGEFEGLLEGMMQQLMSKELLYEPMKYMKDNYPNWLAENKDKLSAADYARYQKQHELCKQVVAKFDSPDFDEKNDAKSKEIIDLMQKMQDLGQPPASMMEDMAPGIKLGDGGMPESMENCNMM
ncbi:Pex19 protein family-domain-containing protein [Dichotomocladium elegans]|nr:Pex19 protein family-domain-containing protein [Dichotomocladium elegans]